MSRDMGGMGVCALNKLIESIVLNKGNTACHGSYYDLMEPY